MQEAARDLEKKDIGPLLEGMKKRILELHQAEEKAFSVLDEAIKD